MATNLTRNKKTNSKRANAVSFASGVVGAGALGGAYLEKQVHDYNKKELNGLIQELTEKDGGNYKLAGDAVYTKDEFLKGIDNYYGADSRKSKFSQEYVDMLKEKISSNQDLFKKEEMVVDKALTSENLEKVKNELSTILTTPSINGTQSNQRVTAEELNDFMKSLGVSDKCGITQDDFNTKLTQFFTKEGINVNDIGTIIEQLDRPNGVDSNDYFTRGMAAVQVVDTNYLDNLTTVFEKASTQKAIFSDLHSIKQGAILVRDNLAENGIITKEIASENGLSTELVAGTELTLLGTAVAVLAGFTGIAFKKLFNKNKEENKEKEVDKQSQKTTQMKRGLSQAKVANAMRVQMAEDFENTASHGRFVNNRK